MSHPERCFVVVSNGRSGSTLLVDLLRSHPSIQCDDEILDDRAWRRRHRPLLSLVRALPVPYLQWRAAHATAPVYGFKLKTGGQVADLPRTLRALHRRGWQLIYLSRRDALRQTFSWTVAQLSGRWQSTGAHRPVPPKLTINVETFLANLHTCLTDRQALADLMRPLPHLALVYEDDLEERAQWPATAARLCTLLGVAPAPLTTRIAKTWDRPYAEMVANYAELLDAVAHSPLAPALSPEPNPLPDRP